MPTAYFKEASLAGRDFDRGVPLELGTWTPRIGGLRMTLGGGYIVADRVTETAGHGEWPCRVYRVELPDGDWPLVEPHVFRVPTYRPVAELDAWTVLGPQGREVSALLERAAELSFTEVLKLASGELDPWQPMYEGAVRVATHVGGSPREGERFGALMAAQGAAVTSVERSKGNTGRAGTFDGDLIALATMAVMDDKSISEAGRMGKPLDRKQVVNAVYGRVVAVVWFAAWGYVMKDLLTEAEFEALSARWRNVIGEPPTSG
jgi:hypothetical protein